MKYDHLYRHEVGNKPFPYGAQDYLLKKRERRLELWEDFFIFLAGVGVLGLLAYCLFY